MARAFVHTAEARRARFRPILARTAASRAELDAAMKDAEIDDDLPVSVLGEPRHLRNKKAASRRPTPEYKGPRVRSDTPIAPPVDVPTDLRGVVALSVPRLKNCGQGRKTTTPIFATRETLTAALEECSWVVTRVATAAGRTAQAVYVAMKRLGVVRPGSP